MWIAAALVAIVIALTAVVGILARRAGAAEARETQAKSETLSAQKRADDAVAAQEVRREIDRSSFDDAVDRL